VNDKQANFFGDPMLDDRGSNSSFSSNASRFNTDLMKSESVDELKNAFTSWEVHLANDVNDSRILLDRAYLDQIQSSLSNSSLSSSFGTGGAYEQQQQLDNDDERITSIRKNSPLLSKRTIANLVRKQRKDNKSLLLLQWPPLTPKEWIDEIKRNKGLYEMNKFDSSPENIARLAGDAIGVCVLFSVLGTAIYKWKKDNIVAMKEFAQRKAIAIAGLMSKQILSKL
jgi:hypothetical protein